MKNKYLKYLDDNTEEAIKNYVQTKQEIYDELYSKSAKEQIEKEIIDKISISVENMANKPIEELEELIRKLINGK